MTLPRYLGALALAFIGSRLTYAQAPKSSWTATADSYQPGNEPQNAIDGNIQTFWHTEWTPTLAQFPHTITIDIKTAAYINGITYLPRQDGSSNGNIGQHTVTLSTDGTTWSSPVVTGNYLDDNSQKKTTFINTLARYIRVTATSEAGNRGPWSSAAEIDFIFGSASTQASPSSAGQWGETIDFPIVPVAATTLYNAGKILTWSSYHAGDFGGGTGYTLTATFDPASGQVSEVNVSNTHHDMFCPGISMDFQGRPVVTGGNDAPRTSIYDPGSNAWISGPNMQIPRGYQASATCSDGRTFTIGGSWSGGQGGKNGEIYNPSTNAWSLLPGCPVAPMLTNDAQGVYRADNHGWLFGWKNGYVFQAGPSKAMNWYGTSGSGSQSAAGTRGSDGDAMCGNAIMFDAVAGKILTVGGSTSYQDVDATSNANIITIGSPGATASVQKIGNMAFSRAFANSVVLPGGKVLTVGGQTHPVPFSDDTSVLTPELFNPATNSFSQMAQMPTPRNYHSIALLMADGTVLSGGGGLCGSCTTNHFNAQLFSPPYLFTSSGARATRPVISSVSTQSARVGASFTVTTTSAVTGIELIRLGSNTHSIDTDQRRLPLRPTASGNTYTVTVPSDAGVALPGYYMVFAINSAGTPSVAKYIKITT